MQDRAQFEMMQRLISNPEVVLQEVVDGIFQKRMLVNLMSLTENQLSDLLQNLENGKLMTEMALAAELRQDYLLSKFEDDVGFTTVDLPVFNHVSSNQIQVHWALKELLTLLYSIMKIVDGLMPTLQDIFLSLTKEHLLNSFKANQVSELTCERVTKILDIVLCVNTKNTRIMSCRLLEADKSRLLAASQQEQHKSTDNRSALTDCSVFNSGNNSRKLTCVTVVTVTKLL